jgi:hypothetical protein
MQRQPIRNRDAKEHNMGYAELIERLQALPPNKQAEVFDFVEFLSSRDMKAKTHPRGTWTDDEFAGMAMAQALRGIEDDPVTYTTTDLREHWQ